METIRGFFALEGFIEIETPLLVRSPDLSPSLAPFKLELVDAVGESEPAYLVTSPEFSCKKMLASGLDKIYSLGKVFRNNEPFGQMAGPMNTHNPEFTMLEWYRTGADYRQMMDDTERLVQACALAVGKRGTGPLNAPWRRLSVKEAFAEIGLNLDLILTRDTMAEVARKRGHSITSNDSFDDCFFKIFITEIEPNLGVDVPTILYDYPIQMAALARAKPEDPRYAERFEAYAGGMELCNCFSELVDPVEQRKRFESEVAERKALGKDTPEIDESLLTALASLKPSAGNALGVDRLVMLLAGTKNIEDVILFPAAELFQ